MTPSAQPTTGTPTPEAKRVPFMARLNPELHAGMTQAAEELDYSANSVLNLALEDWLRRRQDDQSRVDRPDAPSPSVVDLRARSGGNFTTYDVVVEGYPVPYLTAHKVEATGTATDAFGQVVLSLDGRFQTAPMSWGEFWPTAWFWANAMAIAAGYTSHGPNGYRRNVHGPSEPADFRAWAENGWKVHEGSGQTGKGYELALTFRWPNMDDGDLQCYSVREEIIRFLTENGARDVCTRLIALGSMMAEPS